MKALHHLQSHFALLLTLGFWLSQQAVAQAADPWAAKLHSLEGLVEEQRSNAAGWEPAQLGAEYSPSDALRTQAQSRAALRFSDGMLVRLKENSTLRIGAGVTGASTLSLSQGTGYFFARKPQGIPSIETPLVTAAIRGTELIVEVQAQQVLISAVEGSVECRNAFGSVMLEKGERALTLPGQAPVRQIIVNPLDAVQWALYYPALLSLQDFSDFTRGGSARQQQGLADLRQADFAAAQHAFSGSDWRDALGRALGFYMQGKRAEASRELAQQRPAQGAASYFVFAAGLQLAAGNVEAAHSLLAQAEARGAGTETLASAIAAQKALIALVGNDVPAAKAMLEPVLAGALDRSSLSPSAYLVGSYVAQAEFDLERADNLLLRLLEISPDSAFALARRAELALGRAELDLAAELVGQAQQLNPDDGYVQAVAGFVALSQDQLGAAETAFARAIRADSASALPRLGMGLTRIRSGDLDSGKNLLQEAVLLEPTVALYRSYLGKAFFELEEEQLAAREYDRALELDPRDPTPLLYRAFQRLSTHRPVEALQDVQASIALNDNRAVYRSRFLLDQDQAVRGLSLGKVYQELEFTRAGEIEAYKSLSRNYSNPSGHTLLSSTLSSQSRAGSSSSAASVMASLLSPVNFNLLQPSSGGQTSLNEYGVLFDRPLDRSLLQTIYRSHDASIDGTAVYTSSSQSTGYYLRATGLHADGYRENDYQRQQTVTGSISHELNPQDVVSLDAAYGVTEKGGTFVAFDPFESSPQQSQDFESPTFGLRYHHQFSPRSHFLTSLRYEETSLVVEDELLRLLALRFPEALPPTEGSTLVTTQGTNREKISTYNMDLQHIFESETVSFITGAQALNAGVDTQERNLVTQDEFNFFNGLTFDSKAGHTQEALRGYGYSIWHLGKVADLTLGVSHIEVQAGRSEVNPPFVHGTHGYHKTSPKIGLIAYPTASTTLRSSYTESLGVAGLSDLIVLEPSFVGGIPQFTRELAGERGRVLSGGADQRFGSSTYVGIEARQRWYQSPLDSLTDVISFSASGEISQSILEEPADVHAERQELLGYLYQTLGKRVTFALDYRWLREKNDYFYSEHDVHRFSSNLTYYAPSGWFASVRNSWRVQQLKSDVPFATEDDPDDGVRDFWNTGLVLGYKLPKRHGVLILALNNAFDQRYRYLTLLDETPGPPERTLVAGFSVNF